MFDLSLLSKYRGQLMGFSIFIIVLYHFCNLGGNTFVDIVLKKIFSHGYIGVDFFMVLSGLGLTYSLSHNENLKIYYLKRWVRIFPFFTFITLVECYIIRGEPLELAFIRSTTLGYYCGFAYIDWFVPGIVGLYVIFPALYFGVIKPRRFKIAFILCGIIMLLSLIISPFNILDWKHFALLYRIPAFILGAVIAMCIKYGYDTHKVKIMILFSSVLGIAIALLSKMIGGQFTFWLFDACMTPFYLMIILKIFSLLKIDENGGGKILSWISWTNNLRII